MLDKTYLRANAAEAKAQLAKRGDEFPALVDKFLDNDRERREKQLDLDQVRSELNIASKQIGELVKAGKMQEAEQAKQAVKELKLRVKVLDSSFSGFDEYERLLLLGMPNLPHTSIPVGGEEAAEIVAEHGEPRSLDFEPLDHIALCQQLELVNFEAGARLAGSGFPAMHGQGALLQRALIHFMLDLHTVEHGYTEIRPPYMVHPRCAEGTGQLPKFGGEMYHVSIQDQPKPDDIAGDPRLPHYFLIPTAEVPVCNYYREQILEQPTLPIKLCAYSPCWRVEGGWEDLEELTGEAERVLELLGLAYRRKVLPTGDMAWGSAKTYDLEVYCPAERAWREVSSASNTTDYQARRMNTRIRRAKGEKPIFPHLLNASGTALPRLVIALLETHQTERGTVAVPEVLHKYMSGATELTPPESGVPFV
jgi:seryl-tRNA synthetase